MVAYGFERRFVRPIRTGLKRQTIRGPRKRHARPGEPVQLYFGMRTAHCQKIVEPDPVCLAVDPVRLFIPALREEPLVEIEDVAMPMTLDFALADGFGGTDPLGDLLAFWRERYGSGWWDGVLIRWEGADA